MKKSSAKYDKVLVTPAMAQKILDSQRPGGNRKLNLWSIYRLEKKINDGKWNEDVSKIIVTRDTGRLIDGQHRLHAIVRTGVPVTILVCVVDTEAEGLEIMKNVDSNARRTTTQTLKILGHNYQGIDISSANFIAFLEEMGFPSGEPKSITSHMETLDSDDTVDFLEDYRAEQAAMRPVLKSHKAACVYGALVFAAKKFPTAAARAMEFLIDLQVNGDPVLAKFKEPVKGLLKKDLGGAQPRATTAFMVLELVRSLATGNAQFRPKLIDSSAEVQADLVRFFTVLEPGDGVAGLTVVKKSETRVS